MPAMTIWIDGDACPNPIKNVLFKAANKRQINTVLVANHHVRLMPSPYISSMQVAGGFDVADNTIVERMSAGDLVITADIPLADEVITKGGHALNPRGRLYDKENIKSHLSRRDMMEELRASGTISGGPAAFSPKDVQTFANALDRIITKQLNASR